MKSIAYQNRLFFSLVMIWTVFGAVYVSCSQKTDLVYFFSDHRSAWSDFLFIYLTKLGEEPAYVLIVLFLMLKKIRHGLLIGAIGFVVMGISFLLKNLFLIDRPLAFFRKNNLIETINLVAGVDVHTGATSFPSGHAMSAFALYSLLILYLPNKARYVIPLFGIAVCVAISRVYLVQHFFPDVYAGSIIGVALALLFYSIDQRWILSEDHFMEKPLWRKKA